MWGIFQAAVRFGSSNRPGTNVQQLIKKTDVHTLVNELKKKLPT